MEKMIAVCGINCAECPALLATRDNDDHQRKEVAEQWSREYQAAFTAEDINCDGCTPGTGRLFSHCHVCEIRKCGRQKGLANCAACDEYPCPKLSAFFKMVPQGQTTLDEIRNGLSV
jgi:hypothetical protein